MSDSVHQTGFVPPEISELAGLFAGYEIQGLIAVGGMGAVYVAIQKSLDRQVALKILPIELSKDAAFRAGFEAEAKAMARLNHPNLIGVYDFGEAGGMLYIIMEYVPGQSLYHATYQTALESKDVIRLMTGICNGLANAHENGIIHRDIKPANILLDLSGQPKIGDFGLARPAERKVEEGEEIFGTPDYAAPEVVNSPHSVDYRADLFAVGVMLHELLTGQLPSADSRPASVISRCDPRFDPIIRRATQALPQARHSSAREIANELEWIANSLRPNAGPAVPRGPRRVGAPARKVKKNGGNLWMVMLAVLGLVATGAFLKFGKKPPEQVVVKTIVQSPPAVVPPKPVAMPEVAPVETIEPTVEKTEPAAEPTPPPAPLEEQIMEPTPAPAPKVTAPVPAAPKYDVAGFFDKARRIMLDRAKPLLTTHQADCAENFTDFERVLMREARRTQYTRDTVEDLVRAAIKKWKADGMRIPATPGTSLSFIPEIDGIATKFQAKETAIDEHLKAGLSELAGVYTLGLEKQVERLQATDDPGAIELIEKEIELTKTEPSYFPDLMTGKKANGE